MFCCIFFMLKVVRENAYNIVCRVRWGFLGTCIRIQPEPEMYCPKTDKLYNAYSVYIMSE